VLTTVAASTELSWLAPLQGASPGFLFSLVPLFGLLGWAAWQDWNTRKIPNWLTFSLLGAGLLRALAGPLVGLGDFGIADTLVGCGAGFVLSVPLFAIGARGAGDAKLYIACGAWLGWSGILAVFALEAIVGLIMVVTQCALRGRLRELLGNTGVLVMSVIYVRRIGVEQAQANARSFTSIDNRLPHAVPFLAAALLAVAPAIL